MVLRVGWKGGEDSERSDNWIKENLGASKRILQHTQLQMGATLEERGMEGAGELENLEGRKSPEAEDGLHTQNALTFPGSACCKVRTVQYIG